MVAVENSVEAGAYERSLKRRPSPFVTQLRLDRDGVGTVRIGLNIPSLLHRAMSRLPSSNRSERINLSWRLDTDFTPAAKLSFPKFILKSNKTDAEHSQPPNFKIKLRVEQLRSLTWMLAREARDAAPFIEEEVSEAVLEALGWRAEGRAQRPVHIRGGVLADQVGYGKTAITLALIDCTSKEVEAEMAKAAPIPGKIRLKATLCIVPPHLTRQWNTEGYKFIGTKKYKYIVISTAANLNSLTIEEFQEADIVIIASNLYRSSVYLDNLETLAASGALPAQDGRYFESRVDDILRGLAAQTDCLRSSGSIAVMKEIREARKRGMRHASAILSVDTNPHIENEPEATTFVPTKRLKGKSYRDAVDQSKETKSSEVDPTTVSKKKAQSSQPGPSGLIVEVVIPVRRKASSVSIPSVSIPSTAANSPATTPAASATEASEDSEDSDAPRIRKVRTATKKAIIISDDEDEEASDYSNASDGEPVASRKKPAPKKGRSKAKATTSSSSDYEDESLEQTASDSDSASLDASSEEDEPKRTSKAKPKKALLKTKKAPVKSAKKAQSTTSSEATGDDMDVDEDEGPSTSKTAPKKATKKRKADEEGKQPAKKQKRREETDPWKLESSAVKRDWTQMQAPPLEMFHWSRIVVDEYTYLDGKTHSMVTRQTGDRRWVLSGTVSQRVLLFDMVTYPNLQLSHRYMTSGL